MYIETGSESAQMRAQMEIPGAETMSEKAGVQRGEGRTSWREAEVLFV